MKKLTNTIDSMSTSYVGKRPYYPKGRTQRVGPPFFQQSFKGKDNFNPSKVITQDLNHEERKFGVSYARKWVMELKNVKYILLKRRQQTCNPI
jgi:hypothetical protein